eukprot:NODE_3845_length_398_cov_50.707736_g3407_i0.p1 GENE.NODE_3845_length_398_cov_50.707736_g3407_i0~~NODE_3845_length_398_cov_50.707736_g3407_i0.p1  ORF type:complete len:84 (+),score=17.96 NODE_3845_length_398_cov_50.707736_g3407_i0:23-253(+)
MGSLVEHHKVDPGKVIFLNVVSAPEGLRRMHEEFPTMKIITMAVDAGLNEAKFIVPGLGDFGDRYFGTRTIRTQPH